MHQIGSGVSNLQLALLLLGSCPGSLAVRCSTARSCRGPKSANLHVHFALGKVLGITSLRKSVIIHGRVLHRGLAVLFMAIYQRSNVAYTRAPSRRGGRFLAVAVIVVHGVLVARAGRVDAGCDFVLIVSVTLPGGNPSTPGPGNSDVGWRRHEMKSA